MPTTRKRLKLDPATIKWCARKLRGEARELNRLGEKSVHPATRIGLFDRAMELTNNADLLMEHARDLEYAKNK